MHNVAKFTQLAQIGRRLAADNQLDATSYASLLLRSEWWQRLAARAAVPFERFVKMDGAALVQELVENGQLDLRLLPEFCADFGLGLQAAYVVYLKNLLVNWKPAYEIEEAGGRRRLAMRNDAKGLLERCLEVVECICDKGHLYRQLQEWWEKVSGNKAIVD